MNRVFSHPLRWLFYCLLLWPAHLGAQGPAMTTVSDVVYRANGQPATGTILVSWPAFNTADGKPVAAGELSVAIGAQGNVSVQLAPNEGGDPGGTFYKAVYKLTDGTTYTEYWVVPAASPTTVAAIRATVVPRQVGAQFVNRAYVDTAVANTHEQVVHKSGTETITGVKNFAASPEVPEPATGAAAVNKDYVTGAISLISQGFVDKGGDTMTGPLTLMTDPVAPGHATNRGYVDLRVNDMQAGLTNKLGRFNDTPITLAGVRYTPGFAPGGGIAEKMDSGCADLGGAPGTLMVPSFEPTSMSTSIPDDCMVWDLRGTSGFNQYGTYQASRLKGWNFYHRMTASNSVSPTNQTFGSISLFTDIAAGGINNVGNKSNYEIFQIKVLGTTLGQKHAGGSIVQGQGYGDAVGWFARCDGLGGIRTGGDEGCIGLYGQGWQDQATYVGTVNGAPSGNVVPYTETGVDYYLGVGRPLVGAVVYSAGTACASNSGSCPGTANGSTTIKGVGTFWTTIPAPATDYCFSLDAATHVGNVDLVFPITAITSDTTLTINGGWPTTETNAAGTYKIRKCSEITAVDRVANTVTVVNGSLFSNGDAISAPPAPENTLYGGRFSIRSAIASTGARYGVQSNNLCTGMNLWCRGSAMFSGGGNWHTLLEAADSGIAPAIGINMARSNALAPRTWLSSSEGAGGDGLITDFISQTRHSLVGGSFVMRYTKNNPTDSLVFSGAQNYVFTIGNSGSSKFFDVRENGGVPILRADTNANAVFINNSADLFGYSGNQSAEKWRIFGASGDATFNAVRAGDTATAGGAASALTVRGGDATAASGTGVGGGLIVRPGGASSASGTPGNLQIAQTFQKDTTVTSGYLQCFKAAAAMTVGDCGNSATNSVGVAISASNTNPVVVQFAGVATLQFDSTASPSAGWFACTSTNQGGKVAVQSGACAAGRQVGIVAQNGTSITSGKVFLQAR